MEICDISEENNKSLIRLLENSFPTKLKSLHFESSAKCKIDYYMKALSTKCLPIVVDTVTINGWMMWSSCLNEIVKSCYQCQTLWISYWKITNDNSFDFKINKPYNISSINFIGTGSVYYSDWNKNSIQFKSILKAMAKSGLLKSLKMISLMDWGIKQSEAKTFAAELGMDEVQFVV